MILLLNGRPNGGEKTRNKETNTATFKVSSIFLFSLFFLSSTSQTNSSKPFIQDNVCQLRTNRLSCDGTKINTFSDLEFLFKNHVEVNQTVARSITHLQITNLTLLNSTLHLKVFENFSNLKSLDLLNCTLRHFNDLSNNSLSSLPFNFLKGLESLKISASNISCKWVFEELWEFWEKKGGEKSSFLKDQDDIFCHFHSAESPHTFLGVLKAKTVLKVKCKKVTKIGCTCKVAALKQNESIPSGHEIVHTGPHGNISMSFEVNCINMNLTSLPELPSPTTTLKVSHNSIRDLSPLEKREDYKDLRFFDASYNEITSLEPLYNSTFLSRMHFLGLDHNKIQKLTNEFILSIQQTDGNGKTKLGYNEIFCDCATANKILPFIRKNEFKFPDYKKISCSNFNNDGNQTSIEDLNYKVACDPCKMEDKSLTCDGAKIKKFLDLEKTFKKLIEVNNTAKSINTLQLVNLELVHSTLRLEIFDIFQDLEFLELTNCTLRYIKDVSNNSHPQLNFLNKLKSLKISGRDISCKWVMEELWEFWRKKGGENNQFLKEQDATFCHMEGTTVEGSYTFLGALKAKTVFKEKCKKVLNIGCVCNLDALRHKQNIPIGHEIVHDGAYGNISISFEVKCIGMNLKNLPELPSPTVSLNMSNNSINDLSPVGKYKDLQILDLSYNEITNLEPLDNSPILSRLNFLGLDHNKIRKFPSKILLSIQRTDGYGVTTLSHNTIFCDCATARELLPIFRSNIKKFPDFENVFCSNFDTGTEIGGTRITKLEYKDVCIQEIEDSEFWWYLTIGIELFFIILILGKTWQDHRTYMKTGALPWFSAKMPRLPCDFFLIERFKKDVPSSPKQLLPHQEKKNLVSKYIRSFK